MSTSEILAAVAAGKLNPTEAAKLIQSAPRAVVKSFKITADSPKGVFTITLPGMGMAIAPPAEAVEALVANVDALKAALAKHGAERKATRAAYKQTDAYKASAKQMFDAATVAKASKVA